MTGDLLWKWQTRNRVRSVLTGERSRLNRLQAYYFMEGLELGQQNADHERAECPPKTVVEQKIAEYLRRFKFWELCELITNWRSKFTPNKSDFVDTQLRAIRQGGGGPNARRDVENCFRHCEQNPKWLKQQLESFFIRRTLGKPTKKASRALLAEANKKLTGFSRGF